MILIASLHSHLALHTALNKYKAVLFVFIFKKYRVEFKYKLENCQLIYLKLMFLKEFLI